MLINNIRIAGQVLHSLLDKISKIIKPGITGNDINSFAENYIYNYGTNCRLACKGYMNFPASLCVSINEEIIHGIPSNKIIKKGDLVKVDIVIEYKGWYADSSNTFIVGKGSRQAKKLVNITKQCLYKAIEIAIPGNTTGDIGYIIQQYAKKNGYSVMKDFTGHGIGMKIHQDPSIPCFGNKGEGVILEEGMYICIEPMIFMGKADIEKGENGWGIKSKDNSLTAHFEHTIEIQKEGRPVIIT